MFKIFGAIKNLIFGKSGKQQNVIVKAFIFLLKSFCSLFKLILMWAGPVMFPILIGGAAILIIFPGVKEKVQEVATAVVETVVNSLNQDIEVTDMSDKISAYDPKDLDPFPSEVTECEICKQGLCIKRDHFLSETTTADGSSSFSRIKDTERIDGQDWVYTGWTYDDKDFWDVDFSKFSDRKVENQSREYLFKWGINRYGGQGKQLITYETSGVVDSFDTIIDETTRKGQLVKSSRTDNQYLDLGGLLVKCTDGRIESAFPPMVTAGQKGFENLIKAKQVFHKADVWGGLENSFRGAGLDLWAGDIGRGAYIDVVFEDEQGRQFVIPFVYQDAKNIHWFDGAGQQVDQRYGQTNVNRRLVHDRGSYTETIYTYSASFRKVGLIGEEDKIVQETGKQIADFKLHIKDNTFEDRNYNLSIADIGEGKTITELLKGPEYYEDKVFYGINTDGSFAIYELVDFERGERQLTKYYISNNDELTLRSSSALELMYIIVKGEIEVANQDKNKLAMAALLENKLWGGYKIVNNPNCKLIGMRVYPNAHTDSKSFMERMDEFNTTSTLPANNKIIEYCHPDCTCTICPTIAR